MSDRPLIRRPSEPKVEIHRQNGMWHWELSWYPPCTRHVGDGDGPDTPVQLKRSSLNWTKRGAQRVAHRQWRKVLQEHHDSENRITYRLEDE